MWACMHANDTCFPWNHKNKKGVGIHKEIHDAAKEYLIENIGELVSAGDIYYDAQQNTWNVKILAKTPHGIFILGRCVLIRIRK